MTPESRPYRFDSPPGLVTRILWFCAGADGQLLRRCPHSDRVKYEGLGGVVLATAVLAVLSGSYAFYTVFIPKADLALSAAQQDPNPYAFAAAAAFGLIWGLVIFNLDRFVVSSAGKGDGEESISFFEFRTALPRLFLAIAIAVTISKPLEIRVMESEIEAQLELEQQEYRAQLDHEAEQRVANRKSEILGKIDEIVARIDKQQEYIEARRLEIQTQRRILEQEAAGEVGSGLKGHGPAWKDKKDNLDRMEAELDRDKADVDSRNGILAADRDRLATELTKVDEQLEKDKAANIRQSNNLDGLVKRIELAHEISPMIGYALMTLFVMIEVAPILFKLMLREGAYDYLEENYKRIAAAREGIELAAAWKVREYEEKHAKGASIQPAAPTTAGDGPKADDGAWEPFVRPVKFHHHEAEFNYELKVLEAEEQVNEKRLAAAKEQALTIEPPKPAAAESPETT